MRALRSDLGALHPLTALTASALGVGLMAGAGPFLGPFLGRTGLDGRDFLRVQIVVASVLLALPALLAVLALRGASWRSTLALAPVRPRPLLLSALLGGALWVGSIGLMEMQSLAVPPPPEYLEVFRTIHRALAPQGPLDALASVFVIALAPGVGEELVMRGVLLPSLVAHLGRAGAVGASALVFAAMHLDPYRFLFTLTIGLLLGALRLRMGSLWPPIVAHASLNALTFVVAPLVDDPTQTTYTPQPLLGLACLAAGGALAVPLLRSLRAPVDSGEGPS